MKHTDDPELLQALARIFATREEIAKLVEYQQSVFNSLQQLTTSHQAFHNHINTLANTHTQSQKAFIRLRDDVQAKLGELEGAHRRTRQEVRQAIDAISYIQREVGKVSQLEDRCTRLERRLNDLEQEERRDDRKDQEQDQRLRRLESK